MKRRFRFLYRTGDTYHWESTTRMANGPRVEHIECKVDWYWNPS